jgi:hypothetical protein
LVREEGPNIPLLGGASLEPAVGLELAQLGRDAAQSSTIGIVQLPTPIFAQNRD